MGFTEQWLRVHQERMQKLKGIPPVPVAGGEGVISFTLSKPTPRLNPYLRLHWAKRKKLQQAIANEIAVLIPHAIGRPPIEHAIVTIARYSVGEPDYDGLVGGMKPLIDCLHRMGIIVNDDPKHLTLKASSVRCPTRKEQRTEVSIKALDASPS